MKVNHDLYSHLQRVNQRLKELDLEQTNQTIVGLIKENEDILVKFIKSQLEFCSFYKDIVNLSKENDSKKMRLLLDKYLQKEQSRLNQTMFN